MKIEMYVCMYMVFIPNSVFMMVSQKLYKFLQGTFTFLLNIGVVDNDHMRARNTTVYG